MTSPGKAGNPPSGPSFPIKRFSVVQIPGGTAKVRVSGSGMSSGSICACGTASLAGFQLTGVAAQIVRPSQSPGNGPPSNAQSGKINTDTGQWWFKNEPGNAEISGAACVSACTPSTPANNKLAVWY
ncbi:MAG: hypothetical protein JO112_02790, partial [Planctomycetes bacterium]|nr:hypothetical protein [Planctomycetota bacterium]